MTRSLRAAAGATLTLAVALLAACADGAVPTDATTPIAAAGVCTPMVVTNNAQTVRSPSRMPTVKYNATNCGALAQAVTLTTTEIAGFLSVACPSPVAAPVSFALPARKTVSGQLPVFRGPCGTVSPSNQTIVNSPLAFQGHNLFLTLTDDATGAVLGTAFFSWQDQPSANRP